MRARWWWDLLVDIHWGVRIQLRRFVRRRSVHYQFRLCWRHVNIVRDLFQLGVWLYGVFLGSYST